jgi:F420-0:gamma-glutamyl ligase
VGASEQIRQAFAAHHGKDIAVIVTDSCLRHGRIGVIAFALTACGIDPIRSEIGKEDLFGHKLRITQEAIADQLSTAANFLMGNAAQCTPAVLIRGHGLPFSGFSGWVPGVEPEEDIFRGILEKK